MAARGGRVSQTGITPSNGPCRQSADSWDFAEIDIAGFALARLVGACRFGACLIWRGWRGRCRHHLGAVFGRRTEDAVVSDEVSARAENQWDELSDQFVRREYDVGRAIPPGLLEAQGKPTIPITWN